MITEANSKHDIQKKHITHLHKQKAQLNTMQQVTINR